MNAASMIKRARRAKMNLYEIDRQILSLIDEGTEKDEEEKGRG